MATSKDPTRGSCPLSVFPPELMDHIIGFIPPESHLNLAVTCKFMRSASATVLRLHHEAYTLFRVSSDLQPSTVPTVLQEACYGESAIKCWHVRSFEIWLHRDSWADWKPFSPAAEDPFNTESEALAFTFPGEDIKRYLELARRYLHLSEEQLDEARRELQSGGDGLVKALLFSLCPRLRDIKFVRQEIPPGAQDWPEKSLYGPEDGPERTAMSLHSLTWLKRAIWNTLDGESYSWAPGFLAFRTVAVGVRSGMRSEGSFLDDGDSISFEVFLSLLRLPNIYSLYFSDFTAFEEELGIDYDDDEHTEEAEDSWRIELGCSSVEHLYLDDFTAGSRDFTESILCAPKQLVSFSYRAGSGDYCNHVDSIMDRLVEKHGKTLKSLMFHGDGLRGYRCSLYLPSNGVLGYDDLRHVTINASDLILDYTYEIETKEGVVKALMDGFSGQFPETLEVFNVIGNAAFYQRFDFDILEALDDCFVQIIESGKWKNLKAIYLTSGETRSRNRADDQPKTKFAFQDAIAAGRRNGVDVYTVSNKDHPKHPIDFPVAPDKYDLVTGPFEGSRPTDRSLRLDHHNGLWEPVGCGYCGKCEDCFQVYPENVWESLDDVHT